MIYDASLTLTPGKVMIRGVVCDVVPSGSVFVMTLDHDA